MKSPRQIRPKGGTSKPVPQLQASDNAQGGAADKRPGGLTVVLLRHSGGEWARVDFEPEMRVCLEHAAAHSGRSIEQIIRGAIAQKLINDLAQSPSNDQAAGAAIQSTEFGLCFLELENKVKEAIAVIELLQFKLADIVGDMDYPLAQTEAIGYMHLAGSIQDGLLDAFNSAHTEWRQLRECVAAQNRRAS